MIHISHQIVIITGFTGFIGSHLVAVLQEKNIRIICLVRNIKSVSMTNFMKSNVELREVDLTSEQELINVLNDLGKCLIVCLAGTGLRTIRSQPNFNYLSAKAMCNAFDSKAVKGSTLIFASSIKALNPKVEGKKVPIKCEYGQSKRNVESYIKKFVNDVSRDTSTIILRIPAVFGPGDKNLRFLFMLSKIGVFPYLSTELNRKIPVIYIDDLISKIIDISNNNSNKNFHILSCGYYVEWNLFINLIERFSSSRFKLKLGVNKSIANALIFFSYAIRNKQMTSRLNDLFYHSWDDNLLPSISHEGIKESIKKTTAWYYGKNYKIDGVP